MLTHQTRDARLPAAARRQLMLARQQARQRFAQARRAEGALLRSLRQVARQIGGLANVLKDDPHALDEALRRYSATLRPWAGAVARRMQAEVDRRDASAWEVLAASMGRSLRQEILQAPVGVAMRNKLAETVELITSMPLKAAERVQRLTVSAVLQGKRAKDLQEEIARSGRVSMAHALTIARTEVSRSAALLTRERALAIGSPGYFWRTVGDSDVRDSHRALEGKFIPWNKPPVVDRKSGRRAHAGEDINDRCWAEPVLPDTIN